MSEPNQAPSNLTTAIPPLRLGRLVATPGAIAVMTRNALDPAILLTRHRNGDWGELSPEDWASNGQARLHGLRILSAFHLDDRSTLWIITEADRSSTCILLPSEY